MRALTNDELRLVTGGQDSGGGDTGGTPGGDTGGAPGGDTFGYTIPDPFGGDTWSGYYNDAWGPSGDYTTSGIQYHSDDGWTVRVGTLDHRKDPGKVDGAQVTVTVPLG